MKKRALSLLLATTLLVSAAACGDKTADVGQSGAPSGTEAQGSAQGQGGTQAQGSEQSNQGNTGVSSTQVGNIVERSKGVTYRMYNGVTPATLSGHDTTTADASFITNYTTMGFYDFKANDAGDAYEFICEMAEEFPEDITSKYAGDPRFGVPEDATENYAYSIKLNKDAKWEDGTPITADDYIYSYSQLVNPEMKNIRASEIYSGNLVIANAEAYYKQGNVYEDVADNEKAEGVPEDQYFFSMTEPVVFFGLSAKDKYDSNKDKFMSADGRDLYELYSKERYNAFTEQAKADLTEIAVAFGDNNPEAYKEFCFIYCENPAMDFTEVGMQKVGEYELDLILGAPTTDFFIKYGLTSNYLVNKDLYENGKKKTGDIVKTNYGNDMSTYMSYGPYKITEYIKDKLVVLTMNENWYGWLDGRHEYYGNFETLRYDIIPEYETAFQMFLKGELDRVGVSTGKDEYVVSDYLYRYPAQYTYCLNFHCNKETLKSFETPGINKTMISYKDFRQAIALGINKTNFQKALGPLRKAGNAMLNEIYITDPDTGQSYRDSEYGKQALIDVYGGTDVDAGYDPAKAKELAMKAYEEAKANGDYHDGDVISLLYPTASETEFVKLLMSTIETSVLEILKGTPLEGKFKVSALITDEWSKKMQSGEAQINSSGGGGGALSPYTLMKFNINPDKTYGIDYSQYDITMTIDGKEITQDCIAWVNALIDGEYRNADSELKTYILSRIESTVLQQYASIPNQYSSTDVLLSMRATYQLENYVPMVNLGTVQFSMTDAEWDAYVKEQGGVLDYK